MPPFKRLYVWSVILEPMFFFVLFEESVLGVTGNLSRILQILACVALVWRLFARFLLAQPVVVELPNPRRPLYRYYLLMILLAAVAGVIGYVRGAYETPSLYYSVLVNRSTLSGLINSETIRPLFEYVTALYYFGYFVVLPQYVLTSSDDVDYALDSFKRMFVVSFVIGSLDLLYAFSFGTGLSLIPRHAGDSALVEARFHGLAGEPRQAFVYLFLGMAMLHLRAFRQGRPLGRRWGAAIIAAALLTQSTTGLVAIALFVALYAVYAIWGLTFRRIVQLGSGLAMISLLTYLAVVNTPRTMAYLKDASSLWTVLETGEELPYLMSKSNSDIYPMYDLTVKAREGDWLPVIIGSGFGSASAATNRYYRQWSELANPHSQLARALYETGLVGLLLYVMSFTAPIKALTRELSPQLQHTFMTLTLLLVACSLADRSSAPFVYLGTAAVALRLGLRSPAPGQPEVAVALA